MRWSFNQGLVVFIILVCIEMYFDVNMYVCNNVEAKLSIILHHISSVYGMFGSILLGYYKLHLCFMIFICIEQSLLGHCVLTKYTQSKCKENTKWHNDFLTQFVHQTGCEEKAPYVIGLCIFMIIFDSYMIYKG